MEIASFIWNVKFFAQFYKIWREKKEKEKDFRYLRLL